MVSCIVAYICPWIHWKKESFFFCLFFYSFSLFLSYGFIIFYTVWLFIFLHNNISSAHCCYIVVSYWMEWSKDIIYNNGSFPPPPPLQCYFYWCLHYAVIKATVAVFIVRTILFIFSTALLLLTFLL